MSWNLYELQLVKLIEVAEIHSLDVVLTRKTSGRNTEISMMLPQLLCLGGFFVAVACRSLQQWISRLSKSFFFLCLWVHKGP